MKRCIDFQVKPVISKSGDYCVQCLARIKQSGLRGRKAFQGYWYETKKEG